MKKKKVSHALVLIAATVATFGIITWLSRRMEAAGAKTKPVLASSVAASPKPEALEAQDMIDLVDCVRENKGEMLVSEEGDTVKYFRLNFMSLRLDLEKGEVRLGSRVVSRQMRDRGWIAGTHRGPPLLSLQDFVDSGISVLETRCSSSARFDLAHRERKR